MADPTTEIARSADSTYWPTEAELNRDGHAPNRCCDFHHHVADGCCHCDLLGDGGMDRG